MQVCAVNPSGDAHARHPHVGVVNADRTRTKICGRRWRSLSSATSPGLFLISSDRNASQHYILISALAGAHVQLGTNDAATRCSCGRIGRGLPCRWRAWEAARGISY